MELIKLYETKRLIHFIFQDTWQGEWIFCFRRTEEMYHFISGVAVSDKLYRLSVQESMFFLEKNLEKTLYARYFPKKKGVEHTVASEYLLAK